MNKKRNTRLSFRFNVVIISLLTVVLSIFGFYILANLKNYIYRNTEAQMFAHLHDIRRLIDANNVLYEKTSNTLKNIDNVSGYFKEINYLKSGYAFIISSSGNVVLHPEFEQGKNISHYLFFRQMSKIKSKQKKIEYLWPENKKGEKFQMYFVYHKSIDSYIGISVKNVDVLEELAKFRLRIIISIIISIIIIVIGITIFINSFAKIIIKLENVISDLAKGKQVTQFKYKRNDEIGKITNSINTLADGLRNTSQFASEMGRGEFNTSFKPLSQEDVLGNSLLNMRQSLIQAQEEQQKRKLEDEKQNWATQGLAQFGEILRQNNNNIEKLSYDIIKNLVSYCNLNQGAIFILNDEDDNNKFLELTACYAYEKRKYVDRRIEIGEGLVGACFYEKKTVHLEDIPDGYILITSGLGLATPKELLIVPLVLNEVVYGVLELASFNSFKDFEIQFIEKIAESIASTVSSVKINLRTSGLLEKSREQAEINRIQEEEMRQNLEELRLAKEEAARQGEELASITNSVNHTLIRAEYDTKGILIYANTKFLTKLGYSSFSEIEGRHISSFIHERDKEWFFKIWNKLASGGRHFEGDMKHITKQGRDFWSMATYTCVRDQEERINKVLFLGIDTTEQKKLSLDYHSQIQALNQSNIKAEYSLDGSLIQWNDRFKDALGYSDNELAEKTIYDFLKKKDIENAKILWAEVISGKAFEGQARQLTKQGDEKWFNVIYIAIKDMYGDISKVIYIANDISKQKQMEREVKAVKIRTEKTLEGMLDAIITFDSEGTIEFFNAAAENLSGYNRNEILNKSIKLLLTPEITENADSFNDFLKEGVGVRREIKLVQKSQERVSVLMLLSEAEVNDVHTYTAFIQNIEVELF